MSNNTKSTQTVFKLSEMDYKTADAIRARRTQVDRNSFIVLLDGKPVAKVLFQLPAGGLKTGMERCWTYMSVLTPEGEWLYTQTGQGGAGYDKAMSGLNVCAGRFGIPRLEGDKSLGGWDTGDRIVKRIAQWHGADSDRVEAVHLVF